MKKECGGQNIEKGCGGRSRRWNVEVKIWEGMWGKGYRGLAMCEGIWRKNVRSNVEKCGRV